VTDDEKIPPSDDSDNDNPFENFINKDLGMENVLPDAKSGSDNKAVASSNGVFDDDDDTNDDNDADDDSFSSTSRFGRLGSAPRPPSPFSSSGFGSRFGGSSSGYNSPFGRSNPNNPNNTFGGLGAGSSGSSSYFGNRFSAPPKFPAPPVRKTFSQRLWANLRAFGLEAWVVILMSLVALLLIVSTWLYIDNLRLQIAVGEGQITELRYQIQQLEDRLATNND
jgi:hypothetical protein